MLIERRLDHHDIVLELDGDAVMRAAAHEDDAGCKGRRHHPVCCDGRRAAHGVGHGLRGVRDIHLDVAKLHIQEIVAARD